MALWTVMVYLSGDNNLTEEMILALKEIQRIQPNGYIKVVAQFDPSGLGIPTRRYDFSMPKPGREGDGNLDRFAVDDVVQLDETNTGNPEALSDFILWAKDRHGAENYFLILSGHGSGAEEDFLLKDESSGDSLTIPELQWAICQANIPIRILGLDNCLMSTAEVIDSVSRHRPVKNGEAPSTGDAHVEYVIASEGFAPSQGWPYHRFLESILKSPQIYLDPKTTVANVLELVVDGYGRFYSDYDFAAGESTDISAIEVKEIAPLRDSLAALTTVLTTSLNDPAFVDQLLLAKWSSQTYKFGQYVDLRDFCEILRDRTQGVFQAVSDHCQLVVDAVKHCVVRSCCTGPRVQRSYGLSMYFPWAVIHESYQQLSMPQETGWFDFLLAYLEATRRPSRHQGDRYKVHRPLLVPLDQQCNVQRVFQKRKRPDLGISLGLGFLEAPNVPSSYAADSNGEKRYVQSKYVQSKFQPGASDLQPVTQWIQNPATGSGATCYVRGKDGGDEFPLKRDEGNFGSDSSSS